LYSLFALLRRENTVMKIYLYYALIVLVLSICVGCNYKEPLLLDVPLSELSSKLDSLTPKLMTEYSVEGVSVSIIRNGQISLNRYFGYSDVESARKIDEFTVYRAASLGKPIFAYIVVMLAKDGIIDLDVSLYSYFNQRAVKDDARSEKITARMVLSHSSGLPNFDITSSDIDLAFYPGEEFKYSGHGYLFLQRVVETLTGKSLNTLAKELVFKPLKMKQSSFVWEDRYREFISSSYDDKRSKHSSEEKPNVAYAAWSLFTTLEDYSIFVSHIINTSEKEGSVANLMLPSNIRVTDEIGWGLGWGLQGKPPANTSTTPTQINRRFLKTSATMI